MCSVPTGALTNVLIRGDFHLKEIPFDHPKNRHFCKKRKFYNLGKILAVKNDVIEEFLPRARLQCPVQNGFLNVINFLRG